MIADESLTEFSRLPCWGIKIEGFPHWSRENFRLFHLAEHFHASERLSNMLADSANNQPTPSVLRVSVCSRRDNSIRYKIPRDFSNVLIGRVTHVL